MLVLFGKTEPLGKFRCILADTMRGDIEKIRWNGKLDSSGSRDGRRGPELANVMTNLRFP